MPRIVHFELSADDPERAVRFYEQVFGWKSQKWDGPSDYWLVQTGPEDEPGIDGAIQRRADGLADLANVVEVPSIDDALAKVTDSGGTIVYPKTAIPGVGNVAYFADTEGNVLGMIEGDDE
jgi:predicted enzyme related to lactoylglutathione lyase